MRLNQTTLKMHQAIKSHLLLQTRTARFDVKKFVWLLPRYTRIFIQIHQQPISTLSYTYICCCWYYYYYYYYYYY